MMIIGVIPWLGKLLIDRLGPSAFFIDSLLRRRCKIWSGKGGRQSVCEGNKASKAMQPLDGYDVADMCSLLSQSKERNKILQVLFGD